MLENSRVIKEGTALYSGTAPYSVKITKSQVWYGSGDYEDPPEIREDREVECYYVWYESPAEGGTFKSRSGAFATLSEAMAEVDRVTSGTVRWL